MYIFFVYVYLYFTEYDIGPENTWKAMHVEIKKITQNWRLCIKWYSFVCTTTDLDIYLDCLNKQHNIIYGTDILKLLNSLKILIKCYINPRRQNETFGVNWPFYACPVLEIKIRHWNWILRAKLPLNEVLHLTLEQSVRVYKNLLYRSAAILHLCKIEKLRNQAEKLHRREHFRVR